MVARSPRPTPRGATWLSFLSEQGDDPYWGRNLLAFLLLGPIGAAWVVVRAWRLGQFQVAWVFGSLGVLWLGVVLGITVGPLFR
ncbi:MAG TPA: hypothetical protein VNF71_14430 [Acidimicrobiales bacterium]|nr:hypothetical protein [Acidimicrobiales bacterium]